MHNGVRSYAARTMGGYMVVEVGLRPYLRLCFEFWASHRVTFFKGTTVGTYMYGAGGLKPAPQKQFTISSIISY